MFFVCGSICVCGNCSDNAVMKEEEKKRNEKTGRKK
jgi:hypothetical protein